MSKWPKKCIRARSGCTFRLLLNSVRPSGSHTDVVRIFEFMHDAILKCDHSRVPKYIKTLEKSVPNFSLQNIEKQMVPCKSTGEEVSFEWSHHRISSTDTIFTGTIH